MKALVESTTKIVTLVIDGHDVPARVWSGVSEEGISCHFYVTRVAVKDGQEESAYKEFERELQEHSPPGADIVAIPLKLIL